MQKKRAKLSNDIHLSSSLSIMFKCKNYTKINLFLDLQIYMNYFFLTIF